MVYKGKSHLKLDDKMGYPHFKKPHMGYFDKECHRVYGPLCRGYKPVTNLDAHQSALRQPGHNQQQEGI